MHFTGLPEKKYNIIYLDPPWEVGAGPDWASSGKSRKLKYPTLPLDAIQKLPVRDLAQKNCALYLWAINKYLKNAFELIRNWGFNYSTMLTWRKTPRGLGPGGAYVQTTEFLIYARRGRPETRERFNSTWLRCRRTPHSVKPDEFRRLIEKVSGDLPRIELFARHQAPGRDVWGNEIPDNFKSADH